MAINKRKIIDAAQKFVQKGNLDRAIKEYQKILGEDPSDARVLLKVGDLYVKRGDRERAIEVFGKGADVYIQEGFHPQAVAVLKQMLRLDPNNLSIYRRLAKVYKERDLVVDALVQLETAYRRLVKQNRTREALELAREMVEMDPENVAMRIRLAEAYSRENRKEDAVAEFVAAADLLRSTDRIDDFIKVAERLLWHQPENMEVSKEVATLYLRRKEPRRALQKLHVVFKAAPQDVETLELLAEAFGQLGQQDKAATILKELARTHQSAGRMTLAIETFDRVLELNPADDEARQALEEMRRRSVPGPAFRQANTMPIGQHAGEQRVPMAGMDVQRRFNQGRGAQVQGSAARARRSDLMDAVDMDVMNADDLDLLEEADIEEIEPDLVMEEEGAEEDINQVLADTEAFAQYKLYDKAIERLQRFIEDHQDHFEARKRLAALYAESGRTPEAVVLYEVLATSQQKKDKDEAAALLERALALDPNNVPLARRYESLTGRAPILDFDQESGSEEIDFGELSGLQLLDDIEAEAETTQPVFATQELSIQGVRSPLVDHNGSDAAGDMEHELDDLDDLGLINDPGGDDVVELGALADIGLSGEGHVRWSEEERAPVDTISGRESEAGIMDAPTDPGPERERDREDGLLGDGLDQELAELEREFGALDEAVLTTAGDTAMVGMEEFDESTEGADEDVEVAPLNLKPPTDRFSDEEASSVYGEDDLLSNELEQLQEAGQLIATLEKATGEHDSVDEGETSGGEAYDADLDFSDLNEALAGSEDANPAADAKPQAAAVDENLDFSDLNEALDQTVKPPSADGAQNEQARIESEPDRPDDASEQALDALEEKPDLSKLETAWPDEDQEAGASVDVTGESSEAASNPIESAAVQGQDAVERESAEGALSAEDQEAMEADIAETEFFVEQGLYSDALAMYDDLVEQYGSQAFLLEKMERIKQMAGAELISDFGDASAETVAAEGDESGRAEGETATRGYESNSEQDVEPAEVVSDGTDDAADSRGEDDAPDRRFAEVMTQEVARQVSDEDAETHFDLGIAYRDMGMLDQAVDEFRKVERAPSRFVQAKILVAACRVDQNDFAGALNEYEDALASDTITEQEILDVHYQMADIFEKQGDVTAALSHFEEVAAQSGRYRDVQDRLAFLRGKTD
ncbi:MAG: tetratricopeptide repeat protein [Deltaproteobacteria bacterium]|nr:tetratricopeptide repeat protein [Deltaproteobacteria bacterium]